MTGAKEATARLDEDGGPWYNIREKSITDKRSAQETTLQGYPRSRHLPEWRLPRFTVIVMVKLPICTVNVIGMVLTPFCRSVADRLSRYGNALPGPERDQDYFIREWGECQFYLGILGNLGERRGCGVFAVVVFLLHLTTFQRHS